MYSDRQISSLVVCLQRPEAAAADLRLLKQLRPDLDVSSFAVSPRRNQATILRHLLSVTTRAAIEQNRTGGVGVSPAQSPSAPVLAASAASPQKKKPAKKKSSPKKKSTPTSDGTTSTTVTPSSPPSSTTTE